MIDCLHFWTLLVSYSMTIYYKYPKGQNLNGTQIPITKFWCDFNMRILGPNFSAQFHKNPQQREKKDEIKVDKYA